MSTITTTITQSRSFDSLRLGWARFKASYVQACERYGRVQCRRDLIEALEAKSDDDLARLGLSRDTIASHVFRDKFYI